MRFSKGFVVLMKIKFSVLLCATILSSCVSEVVAPLPVDAKPVVALIETQPVSSSGDAADDPAIWINTANPEQSLVIGTDKDYGIEVYDLNGSRVQSIPAGRTNNVDLRYLSDNSNWSAIAAASNRTTNTISLFGISHRGELSWWKHSEIITGLGEPYGLCMYSNADGIQIFVNDTDGRYQQWLLNELSSESNPIEPQFSASLVREFSAPNQPEGCVADDEQGLLFLGVEDEGVRVVSAEMGGSTQITSIANVGDSILAADVEGMSLYKQGAEGYLIVSSQGNYSYAVYDRLSPHSYRGSFFVEDNLSAGIDGSQETDGLSVNSFLRTEQFPSGLLVVQDGFNTQPNEPQNFKYISWQDIADALNLE